MNVIIVISTLIALCSASKDINEQKNVDKVQNGSYKIQVFGPQGELQYKRVTGIFNRNNSDHSYTAVVQNTPENDTVSLNAPGSIDISLLPASIASHRFNPSISGGGHHPGDASVEDDNQSQISDFKPKMIANINNEREKIDEILLEKANVQPVVSSAVRSDCIMDCNDAARKVNFTVTPAVTHFLSGSSFTLVCQMPARNSAIAKMTFEYEGIHFFGPVCTPALGAGVECKRFPSTKWRVVSNQTDAMYSEEIAVQDIEESYSGYYSCVVDMKCCADNGIYSTSIRGELSYPISINSFVQYRTTILVIGGSLVLMFIVALVMLGINSYYNATRSTSLREQLRRNRALKDFPFLSSSTDEDKMFIIT